MADVMQVPSLANDFQVFCWKLDVCVAQRFRRCIVMKNWIFVLNFTRMMCTLRGASSGGLEELKRRLLTKVVMKFDTVVGVCGIYSHLKTTRVKSPAGTLILPDARHTANILELTGLVGCNGVSTPIVRCRCPEDLDVTEFLDRESGLRAK